MQAIKDNELHPPKNVLVVEDEPLVRFILAETLRDAGIDVIEAANASEALTYVQASTPIDLVFTDVLMPGELDGVALAERLRSEAPWLPIIITSGTATARTVSGLGAFIPKPYRLAEATELVLKTLAGQLPNDEDRS